VTPGSGDILLIKRMVRGVLTYLPPVERLIAKSTRGTDSARYCYSVWLRHLVMAHDSGLDSDPNTVAELGPGDSLGIGLAALLAGADHYVGLDICEYANLERNLSVFDELVALFHARTPIPGRAEFPLVEPEPPSYAFPRDILSEQRLARSLAPERVEAIRGALRGAPPAGVSITYRVPWFDANVVERDSADMVFSQAVLEHVDDLDGTYRALAAWIKPGGFASHEISFYSHELTREWNGHWAIPAPVWRVIRGRRPYLLNREPASTHVRKTRESGLSVVREFPVKVPSDIRRDQLAARFRDMTQDDLTTISLFLQATRPRA